ncbi:hypothetical protein D3C83_11430 [compost metagenome]
MLAHRLLIGGNGDARHIVSRQLVLFLEFQRQRHRHLRGGVAGVALDLVLHDVPHGPEILREP